MQQIVEATIDTIGQVRLNKKIRLDRKHKALLTILGDEVVSDSEWRLAGSMTLVDEDLEAASKEIADEFNRAIEKSARELEG